MKARTVFSVLFLVIGAVTVLEYSFVGAVGGGMFTGPLMLALSCISGLINIGWEIKNRSWMQALLYLLCTAALSMGYLRTML